MNLGTNKEYTLLLQDDVAQGLTNEPKLENEVNTNADHVDDLEEPCRESKNEEAPTDFYEDDSEESDIYINTHRSLSNEALTPHSPRAASGYKLLTNGSKNSQNASLDDPLSSKIWTPTPMSPVRRAGFLASIMFGILVGAMFLWALPCNVEPCFDDSSTESQRWLIEFDGVIVNYTKLFFFEYRSSFILMGYYNMPKMHQMSITNCSVTSNSTKSCLNSEVDPSAETCGLLLISESLGHEVWNKKLPECPQQITCNLMDITEDGFNDCLVLGSGSMAIMIDPRHGPILWQAKLELKENVSDIAFGAPILYEDINGDGFQELLFPVQLASNVSLGATHSTVALICGKTGQIIGIPVELAGCSDVAQIFDGEDSIGYSCSTKTGLNKTGNIPLSVLWNELLANTSESNDTSLSLQSSLSLSNRDEYPVDSYQTTCSADYQNYGQCPHCKTKVECESTSDNPQLESYDRSAIVAWRDVSYDNQCKAVLVKLWTYINASLTVSNTTTQFPGLVDTDTSESTELAEHVVTESIILMAFNESEWTSRQVTSMQINQLCGHQCLPSQSVAEDSIMIKEASLDTDYWTLYVSSVTVLQQKNSDGNLFWKPVSFLKKIVIQVN